MRFVSPDSIVPLATQGTQALDRYAYANNNPIRYSDPSGHNVWDAIGQFATGFFAELVLQNNWMGAYTAPEVAEALTVSSTESNAMLIGRLTADLVTIGIGIAEMTAGLGTIGGGAVLSCIGTACVGAVATTAAGAAVTAYGAVTAGEGAMGLGENLGRLYSNNQSSGGKSSNPYGSGSGQRKTVSGYNVGVDWESPGGNGNVHISVNGEKIYITDPSDLSALPKKLQNNDWIIQQVQRAWQQMMNYESSLGGP